MNGSLISALAVASLESLPAPSTEFNSYQDMINNIRNEDIAEAKEIVALHLEEIETFQANVETLVRTMVAEFDCLQAAYEYAKKTGNFVPWLKRITYSTPVALSAKEASELDISLDKIRETLSK